MDSKWQVTPQRKQQHHHQLETIGLLWEDTSPIGTITTQAYSWMNSCSLIRLSQVLIFSQSITKHSDYPRRNLECNVTTD